MNPGSAELRPQEARSGVLDSGQAVTPKDTASMAALDGLKDAQLVVARYREALVREGAQPVEFARWLESRPGGLR